MKSICLEAHISIHKLISNFACIFSLTLLFFTLSGLDVLNQLDSVVSEDQRKKLIEWIYSLQITCKSGIIVYHCLIIKYNFLNACFFSGASPNKCGFRGTFSFAGATPLKKYFDAILLINTLITKFFH